jgi:hypothetical protein
MTSSRVIMPMSPWLASAGCTKKPACRCWRGWRRSCCRYARIAHADHDHPALAGHQLAGLDEITVDAGQQCLHGLEFQAHGALGGLDQLAGLAHVENAMPDEKAAIIAAM